MVVHVPGVYVLRIIIRRHTSINQSRKLGDTVRKVRSQENLQDLVVCFLCIVVISRLHLPNKMLHVALIVEDGDIFRFLFNLERLCQYSVNTNS